MAEEYSAPISDRYKETHPNEPIAKPGEDRFVFNGRSYATASDAFRAAELFVDGATDEAMPASTRIKDYSRNKEEGPPGDPSRYRWSEYMQKWQFIDDEVADPELVERRRIINNISDSVLERALTDPDYDPSVEEAKLVVTAMAMNGIDSNYNVTINNSAPLVKAAFEDIDIAVLEPTIMEGTPLMNDIYKDLEGMADSKAHIIHSAMDRAGLVERLSQDDQDDLAVFMASHLDEYYDCFDTFAINNPYILTLFHDLSVSEEALPQVSGYVVDHVANLVQVQKSEARGDDMRYYLDEILRWNNERVLIRGLATHERNQNLDMFFGQVLARHGLARILNTVDEEMKSYGEEIYPVLDYLMGSPQTSPEFKGQGGERQHRVHTDIGKFYQSLNFVSDEGKPQEGAEFQEYVLTSKAEEIRPPVYKDIFQRNQIKPGPDGGLVVDTACGDGWLARKLAKMGYTTAGIDIDPKAIKQARELALKEHARAQFVRGDLKDLTGLFGREAVAAVLVEGGSARHWENDWIAILKNYNEALVDGGICVVDLASPEKGNQAWRLNAYRDYLEKFGYSREWLDNYMWRMVGSPPGQKGKTEHFVDSVILPPSWVEMYANMSGFELVEQFSEANYDYRDSEKITYVLKKVTGSRLEEVLEKGQKKYEELMDKQPQNPNLARIDIRDQI